LYSQLDDEGNRHVLLSDIVDPRRDERAVDKADAYVNRTNGVKRRRETTLGWQLLCKWKDGSTNWVALKDARQSYPVLVAEYALANRIDDEPAFAWWVHDVNKERDRIIAKVKSKYWQRTHKYEKNRYQRQFKKQSSLIKRTAILCGGTQLSRK
jgi:hypothetical protein